MNPSHGLMWGAIVGIAATTLAFALIGWWAMLLAPVFTLAGIVGGERL